ncbi:MAG: galactitol-1-phosphate 5-dehydrogenase [Lachnospiraceae bacterium]|nr:galactitol-1-phosphate 5-dehydrogenase [Lachnospiraceae bacterium]
MRAYVLHQRGDICLESVKNPKPGPGEVLVAVRAAGICGSDIPRVYKNGAYSYPLIPGHEFSGIVTEIGEGVEQRWVGKNVGVFPLIPCKECEPCQEKKYELCRNYSYLGSRRNGGFAELVTVPVENLLEIPANVSLEEAAMLEPMAVAVHAMRRGLSEEASPEEKRRPLAVCGLGTIGLLLVMVLQEAGWENILVIGNKEFQRRMVVELGIPEDSYCDSRTLSVERWIQNHTDGKGVQTFFECVGRNETVTQALNGAKPGSRVVLVGNPASDMILDKNIYWKLLRNQLMVTGTWNSTFIHEAADDWHYVLQRIQAKRIAPAGLITHKLNFESLEQGLHIMRDKTEDYGKIMIIL